MHILDPGAGAGSLTAALVEQLCDAAIKPDSVELVAYEIEPLLIEYLQNTLAESRLQCQHARIKSEYTVCENNFILRQSANQADIFGATGSPVDDAFSHVIMNPPYKKINSASEHRLALRKAGVETSNLWIIPYGFHTGFEFIKIFVCLIGSKIFIGVKPDIF